MITKTILTLLAQANSDLDDMDFNQLFGEEEGQKLFREYSEDHERNLVQFIDNMPNEKKGIFIDYINDQFTPE